MANAQRLSGKNILSYLGVEASAPPELYIAEQQPTTKNNQFNIGTLWLIRDPKELWMLMGLENGDARWIQLYPNEGGGDGVKDFITDSGTATSNNQTINLSGGGNIETVGSGNTVTVRLTNGTDGQVLIGGGTQPEWRNITSNDSTVIITNGPNSIDLAASGGGTASGANTFITDSGTATAFNQEVNFFGIFPITTGATGNAVFTSLENGNNGQVLIGGGSGPEWRNLTSTGGTVAITNGPNSINLEVVGGGGGGTGRFRGGQVAFSAYAQNDVFPIGDPRNLEGFNPAFVKGPFIATVDTEGSFFSGSSTQPASYTITVGGVWYLGCTLNRVEPLTIVNPILDNICIVSPRVFRFNTRCIIDTYLPGTVIQWGALGVDSSFISPGANGTTTYPAHVYGILLREF